MVIKRQEIKVKYEELTPEEWGKELADNLYWEFHKPVMSMDNMYMLSNNEAQECVDAFVIQLYARFNLQGYNLSIKELIQKIKNQ